MKDRTIVFLTHLVIISLLVITGKVFAASPAIIKWDAVIEDTPVHGIASGVTATESAPAMPEFMTAMSRQGVKASQSDGKLKLSGQQSLDQFRSILFDDETEQINFLGGPVEMTITLPAGNQPIRLELESSPTTGYRWELMALIITPPTPVTPPPAPVSAA